MDRSGAGQGSLYHHFRTKKAWAGVALSVVESHLIAQLTDTLGDEMRTPLERVKAWLVAPRDALRGCRLGRLVHEHSVVEDDELREPLERYFREVEDHLQKTLAQAVMEGELPLDLNVGHLATLLASTVQGGYVISRALHNPQKLEQATQAAAELLSRVAGSES
jgi:AcrR family transcriptional regulator